jgi:hypothetical protein
LNLEVREEKGDFTGGLCRIDQDRRIFLNRSHNIAQKIRILSEALVRFPLNDIYVLPAVRDYLEKYGEKSIIS